MDKISFQTNDDFGILSLMTGYGAGGPKPQLVRIFEPLDSLLRIFYTINPNISWYVFFILLIQALSYSVIASIVISKLKDFR
jgi:hypothetical protein